MQPSDKIGNINPESENKQPVKIILADDDKDDQEIFSEALDATSIPTDLKTVDNGQELINTLKDPAEPNPDIIFLDLNMPVKNGKEVLTEIKKDEKLKEIPTVILSTSNHPNEIESTFNSGANLYVQKTTSFFGLVKILRKIFNLLWAKTLLKPVRKAFYISEQNIPEEENN